MVHSERARPSRNSSTSVGCWAISPQWTALPRQRQRALPRQAEFVGCEQTIYVVAQGWKPSRAIPAAAHIKSCSAMPIW